MTLAKDFVYQVILSHMLCQSWMEVKGQIILKINNTASIYFAFSTISLV